MTVYDVRDATIEDVQYMAAHMRQIDREEAVAQTGVRPETALGYSFGMSEICKVGMADEVPVCVFGLSNASGLSGDEGTPWMVATEDLPKHAKEFIKRNREIVELFQDRYKRLTNYVLVENKVSIRWLKWLGFVMMKETEHGPFKKKFFPFYRVRE